MGRIIIIGAGIAGLAAATRLATAGHEVDVYESNDYPGGKLSQFSMQGFRFDAGPSLFTMPDYVKDIFTNAGKNWADYFSYESLDAICHYFWKDGTQLKSFTDPKKFGAEVETQLGVPQKAILHALTDSANKYELTGRIFLEKSLHQSKTWTNRAVLKAMLKLPSLDIFKSMNQLNEQLFSHPKLIQLFNRFATYNGSNPYKVPGILNIIPHFEHHFGAHFPTNGMYGITESLFQLAKDLGVRFHFNQRVDEILVSNKKAIGIRIGTEKFEADQVVSNMDVFFTYKKLLPNDKHPSKTLKQQKSTSALIFYWGVKRHFPELGLHNILFSEDYRAEFEHIDAGKIYKDPTVYINISQKHKPDDAPEGCENWFTMINVPYNSGQNWDQLIEQARKDIQRKIASCLGVDIAGKISCEAILDPRTIESKTASHLGALYGTSSNNRMAAFLRHPNFSNRIENLYFCGGSVHPGGGIPLCLLSGKIVAELIAERKNARK